MATDQPVDPLGASPRKDHAEPATSTMRILSIGATVRIAQLHGAKYQSMRRRSKALTAQRRAPVPTRHLSGRLPLSTMALTRTRRGTGSRRWRMSVATSHLFWRRRTGEMAVTLPNADERKHYTARQPVGMWQSYLGVTLFSS